MSELLRVERVTKAFGGLRAVDRVDMGIAKSQIVGLIGPNGAGKTTLFNVITGVYRPTEGKVYFKGEEITNMSPSAVARRGICRTFQQLQLFRGMTVLDNVLVGAHTQGKAGAIGALLGLPHTKQEERRLKERALYYLELLGLADKQNWLARNLSYGDQRRVEVARALAAEPELLLLDEPSAGMNLKEACDLTEFIEWIRSDLRKTILLIEHNMRVAMPISDRVVVLNEGKKICEGTPSEVQANPLVIEVYLGKAYLRRERVIANA